MDIKMIFVLLLINISSMFSGFVIKKRNIEDVGGLYLAINPLAFVDADGYIVKRRIEINWYGAEIMENDQILVESKDSETISLSPIEYPDDFYVLPGILPYPTIDEMGFTRTCVFGYNATWIRADGSLVANSCLQSEPSWMWDHRNELQYMNIGDMMMVAAHDAGAYRDYQGVGDDNWATSSVFAQEEDLLYQLIWGARFLDIRVGFYPTTDERFWMAHGIIKTHPMAEGIKDVKTFIQSTREIVIWEVNEFDQTWDASVHEEFKAFLTAEFAAWLVVPGDLGWKTPLNDIWQQEGLAEGQGRIIMTYNSDTNTDPTLFFPSVLHPEGGQKDEPEELKEYLIHEVANAENNPTYQPWKPNCQMTPTAVDIILGRWSGLREMADAVNRNMTSWWRDEWPSLPATYPSIDFIKSTNMIQESIERNLRMAKKLRTK